jgi:hypothetical protein
MVEEESREERRRREKCYLSFLPEAVCNTTESMEVRIG